MKVKRKTIKICVWLFFVLFTIGGIFSIWLIETENAIDIGEIKENLYKKELAFERDFKVDTKLENFEIKIENAKMKVSISEGPCELIITYDENQNILEKEFNDYRTTSNVGAVVAFLTIAIPLLISFLVFFVAVLKSGYNEINNILKGDNYEKTNN